MTAYYHKFRCKNKIFLNFGYTTPLEPGHLFAVQLNDPGQHCVVVVNQREGGGHTFHSLAWKWARWETNLGENRNRWIAGYLPLLAPSKISALILIVVS